MHRHRGATSHLRRKKQSQRDTHRPKQPIAPTAKEQVSDTVAPTSSQIAPTAKEQSHLISKTLLAEIKAGKPFFYNTVVAQAQKIEVAGDRVTFVFSPTHRALREQFEQSRSWVGPTAERVAGRRVMVESAQGAANPAERRARPRRTRPRARRQARSEGGRQELGDDSGDARGLSG